MVSICRDLSGLTSAMRDTGGEHDLAWTERQKQARNCTDIVLGHRCRGWSLSYPCAYRLQRLSALTPLLLLQVGLVVTSPGATVGSPWKGIKKEW
jgi:hypothetical protein